jgi:hypothetical protein
MGISAVWAELLSASRQEGAAVVPGIRRERKEAGRKVLASSLHTLYKCIRIQAGISQRPAVRPVLDALTVIFILFSEK